MARFRPRGQVHPPMGDQLIPFDAKGIEQRLGRAKSLGQLLLTEQQDGLPPPEIDYLLHHALGEAGDADDHPDDGG